MIWFLFWLTNVVLAAVNGGPWWAALVIALAMGAHWAREKSRSDGKTVAHGASRGNGETTNP